MGSKKLVYCCILGIVLGFLAPFVLKTDSHVSLMVGMVAGLGIGYLLDVRDSKEAGEAGQAVLNKKADRANKLLERAKRGLEDETLRMHDENTDDLTEAEEPEEPETGGSEDELTPVSDPEAEAAEQAEKLRKAEELLREARDRMNEQ